MREFKIRCSQIGKIMTNDLSGKAMGETAKKFCQEWVKEQIYSRRKEFSNKYTSKGLLMEDLAIDFAMSVLNWPFTLKNEERFSNEFMEGEPDINQDKVRDIKCSWDCFTFPLFDVICPNADYDWQLQGYMALTGKTEAELIYVLMDTPEHLIEREIIYQCREYGYDREDIEAQIFDKMTYGNIPNEKRVKVFEVLRDEAKIKAIEPRVIECRAYIETLTKQLQK